MEKLLVECCLELFAADLIEGIQDLGAAGVACATTELAAGGDGGMSVDMDAIPLRDPNLTPAEILMSESQERMMAVVRPEHVDAFMAICRKWDVEATVIGEVTADGTADHDLARRARWSRSRRGPPPTARSTSGRWPARTTSTRCRPTARSGLARPADGPGLRETLLRLLGSPGLADKRWVTQQYDSLVRGNTVLAMPEDGGLVRVDEETGLGIALATDGNGRYCTLDPYQGTQLALAEAYRNVAMTGAVPGRRHQLPQLRLPGGPGRHVAARRGRPRPRRRLQAPRHPGHRRQRQPLQPDGRHRDPPDPGDRRPRRPRRRPQAARRRLRRRRAPRWCCSARTSAEFGGSAWAEVVHQHLGGRPPAVDLDAERQLAMLVTAAAAAGVLASAHDLSDGGLAIALAEACLYGGRGCAVALPGDPFTALFSESAARALVSVVPGREREFAGPGRRARRPRHGARRDQRGDSPDGRWTAFEVPLAELSAVWTATTSPPIFG